MKGYLRIIAYFLLFAVSVGTALFLHEKWQRLGKKVVVIMRSSNEDCDEFRRIWKIDRVLQGSLDAEERSSLCYLVNSQRSYGSRKKTEWIRVAGEFTHAEGDAYYTDCSGTLIFQDKTVSRIASGTQASSKCTRR